MKRKEEVNHFIQQHLEGKDILIKDGILEDEEKLICYLLPRMIQSPENHRPDGYINLDTTSYMVEHFEFNASMESEKAGSEQNRKLSVFDKDVEIHNGNFNGRIETESSKEQYIHNLIKNFKEHADRYSEYESETKKLLGEAKHIEGLIFLIEDKTFFGAVETKTRHPFEIVLTKEFAECWNQYENVKYIVLAGRCMSTDYCIVYSKNSLDRELKSIKDIDLLIMNNTNIMHHREEILWKK